MKCPRTGTVLKEIDVDGTKVDISEACGGLWLDGYELLKFDEAKESAGEKLVDMLAEYSSDSIDFEKRLNCPRDPEVVMMRRFYSVNRSIEIDECLKCGGVWLDAGELTQIRESFPTKEARDKAGQQFMDEVLEGVQGAGTEEKQHDNTQRLSNFLKWLSPSHYLRGD
jgi:Zn-finger nucleic acid-binding protein